METGFAEYSSAKHQWSEQSPLLILALCEELKLPALQCITRLCAKRALLLFTEHQFCRAPKSTVLQRVTNVSDAAPDLDRSQSKVYPPQHPKPKRVPNNSLESTMTAEEENTSSVQV